MRGTTHIIGAGLAGLSAATRLASAGRHVLLHEAGTQAGGRCRSYYDDALGAVIDNGNHLLLSGNDAAMEYLTRIGAGAAFTSATQPHFDFIDAKNNQRWVLRLNKGRLPLWLLDKTRRVPGTKAADYLSILRLLRAAPAQTAASLIHPESLLYHRLWQPLLVSALNTDPKEASATLAAAVLRGTLLKGGNACIPLVAEGLSNVFIEPALRYLAAQGAQVHFNHRLRGIGFSGDKATTLDMAGSEPITLSPHDNIICAVPPWVATQLLPGICAPDAYRGILNAHFAIRPPADFPHIMGVVNATVEWIFAFPNRISITISNADRLMQESRETLATQLWQEVAAITGLASDLPTWQIVKEKRATFAATPQQNAKRPPTRTRWRNVFLAGDWVQTGLPATIEGAVLSGRQTAQEVLK